MAENDESMMACEIDPRWRAFHSDVWRIEICSGKKKKSAITYHVGQSTIRTLGSANPDSDKWLVLGKRMAEKGGQMYSPDSLVCHVVEALALTVGAASAVLELRL